MITEDYVNFEIAKLLREKGFNVFVSSYYDINGKLINGVANWNYNAGSYHYSAPTLQMVMKWLREVHHLFIGCNPRLSFTDFYWITASIYKVRKKSSLYHIEDVDDYNGIASFDGHSYEEVCKKAIKYCLEKLI